MPHTLVPTDSTARSVVAVATVTETLRDGDAGAPAATTACSPRLKRVVAFMSANQAIGTSKTHRPPKTPAPRSPMRELAATPTLPPLACIQPALGALSTLSGSTTERHLCV